MLQIKSIIKNKKYYKLIDFLFDKCDTFSFVLPNFEKTIVTEKNCMLFSGLNIGTVEIENDSRDFIKYDNEMNQKIKKINKRIKIIYRDVEYFGSIYVYECKIYIVTFCKETLDFLKTSDSLYSWKYPLMPEDLCFFLNDKCYLKSIAHENLCFIYDNSKDTKKALKRMRIKFEELPDESTD